MPPNPLNAHHVPANMLGRRMRDAERSGPLVQEFIPQGPFLYFSQSEKNPPVPLHAKKTLNSSAQGARFLIGFNVGITQVWDVQTIVSHIFGLRRAQLEQAFAEGYATPSDAGGDIAASFVAQQGLWQTLGTKEPYPENGVQVLILNNIREKPEYFKIDMENLAAQLATDLEQQAVLLEHQVNGATVESMIVEPLS